MTGARSADTDADVIVVGSGAAGLMAALEAARLGMRTLIVTKSEAQVSNTFRAQGGIAAVTAQADDCVRTHWEDTDNAGGGLVEQQPALDILADSPAGLSTLQSLGVPFDVTADGTLALTREGGHRRRRIVHCGGDATGVGIVTALLEETRRSNLRLLERHCATQILLDTTGAVAGLNVIGPDGESGTLGAAAVILATGGSGHLFAHTTNPPVATADGIFLGLRAGASVMDMEFIQFHPTALWTPDATGEQPLVTEAVRGEGAILVTRDGHRIMAGHPLADLAPRDVVAAAITTELRRSGHPYVLLDATHLTPADWRRRFPTVYAACTTRGINPASQPIPVAPAAHYQCGGLRTTTSGETEVPGLLAVGEVARTGLHGANRLASNSLLEATVVGRRAGQAAAREAVRRSPAAPIPWDEPAISAPRTQLQNLMTAHCGIGRDAAGLQAVLTFLREQSVPRPLAARTAVEDCALTVAAWSVVTSGLQRTESRGCHRRTDFPATDPTWRRSVPLTLGSTGLPQPRAVAG